MGACKCNYTLSNTGKPGCEPLAAVTVAKFLVPLYDSTGVRNFYDPAVTLVLADFVAKVNDPDPSKRWYPITNIKNLTSEKAESVYETFDDQSRSFIEEGVRTVTFLIPNSSPAYLGQLKDWRCAQFGEFIVDANAAIVGIEEGDGKLYPIGIDNSSWDAVINFSTNTTSQKITLSYQWLKSVADEDLGLVNTDIIGIKSINGLIDTAATITAKTVNGFTAKISTIYGPVNDKTLVKGLLVTDFIVYNVTDAVALTKTMVESTPGTYVFTYTVAQTATDVIRLSFTKSGFDSSGVAAKTFVVV